MWCLPSCLTTLESSVLTEEFYVDLSSSGCIRDQYLSIAQRRLRHKLSKRAGRCLLYVPCQKFLGCLRSDVLGVMGGYLARDVRMLKGTGMRSTLLDKSFPQRNVSDPSVRDSVAWIKSCSNPKGNPTCTKLREWGRTIEGRLREPMML